MIEYNCYSGDNEVGNQGRDTAFQEVFLKRPEVSWPLRDREIMDSPRKAKNKKKNGIFQMVRS